MPVSGKQNGLQCDHGLRRQAIVQSLLSDVIRGRLRAGEHLVTQELADRFGVSHTPVREALMTLAGIGIIELQPNRGAIVRRVTPSEVREICQVRRALECEATRHACGRIDPNLLRSLSADIAELMTVQGATELRVIKKARAVDNALHDGIAASCGNAFLANELSRLTILFRAFRDVGWERYGPRLAYRRLGDEAREHLAVVEALRAGNRAEAARAMARHIRSGVKYWSRALLEDNNPSHEMKPRSRKQKGSPQS